MSWLRRIFKPKFQAEQLPFANKAERRVRLGITHATWLYAKAPCMVNPSHPTAADRKQDAAHQAADGKKFEIKQGLLVDGEWTFPGHGPGCKCVSESVIPGLENFTR